MSIWPGTTTAVDEVANEMPVDDETLRRWQESLYALQRQADEALGLPESATIAQARTYSSSTWVPPADLGPLPEIFRERAQALAALQQRTMDVLAASRTGVEQEMAELARPRRQVQPVYVDVTG